jgi:hypothetical protein
MGVYGAPHLDGVELMRVDLEANGTWSMLDIEPEYMATLFTLLSDELARLRSLAICPNDEAHAQHARLVIIHAAMVASGCPQVAVVRQ